MTEEMKMIMALIDHLGLEIRATGRTVNNVLVTDDLYKRGEEGRYSYTVQVP